MDNVVFYQDLKISYIFLDSKSFYVYAGASVHFHYVCFPPSPAAAVELALSRCFAVKEHTCAIHVPQMNFEERAS